MLRKFIATAMFFSISFVFPSTIFAGDKIVYSQKLRVIGEGGQLTFSVNSTELFTLEQYEIANFLQVAKDINNFEKRLGSLTSFGKIASSVVIGFATGGLSGLALASMPQMMPGVEQDQDILRLINEDFASLTDLKYSPATDVISPDVDGLVEALIKVYSEYAKRLHELHLRDQNLHGLDDRDIVCDLGRSGEFGFRNLDRRSPQIKAVLDTSHEKGLWYDISIVSPSKTFVPALWPTAAPDVPVVKVHFHKRFLSISELVIAHTTYPDLFEETFRLDRILATIGVRTGSVNTANLSPNKNIKRAYEWAQTLRECLFRDEPRVGDE